MAIRPLPGAGTPGATGGTDASAQAETWPALPGSREPRRDASFPTSYARFSIDNETRKLSIKIVDAVTNEVLREIPPEQVQRIAEDLQSLARRGSIGRRPGGPDASAASGGTPGSPGAHAAGRVAGAGVDRYV